MFIAKFSSTSGSPFTPDKNGNYPFIGTVVSGKYYGSIINGSVFQREELATQQLYLCQNTLAIDSDGVVITDSDDREVYNVEVISKVSVLELVQMQAALGAPFRLTAKVVAPEPDATTTTDATTTKGTKKAKSTVTEPVAGMDPDPFGDDTDADADDNEE